MLQAWPNVYDSFQSRRRGSDYYGNTRHVFIRNNDTYMKLKQNEQILGIRPFHPRWAATAQPLPNHNGLSDTMLAIK